MDDVETPGRLHQQQRSNGFAPPECVEHGGKRDIAQSVSIVREKHLLALHVGFYGLKTLTDVGTSTRLNKGDCPVIDVAVQKLDVLPALRPDKIVRYRFIIVQEVI